MNEQLTYLFLFFSVIFGALLGLYFYKRSQSKIKLLISFSGAYLFAITILHLLPELYMNSISHSTGIFILVGFILQIILEHFTHGVEHGHSHIHGSIPISMMIGLSIHSFLEGMPLMSVQHHDHVHHQSLLSAIVLHKIPVSMVLMGMLMESGQSKMKSLIIILLFAIMSPLGAYSSNIIGDFSNYYQEIMAIVVGTFFHISTTILFESSEGHRFDFRKILAILIGVGVAILGSV